MENIYSIELILLTIEFDIIFLLFFIKLCHFSFSHIIMLIIMCQHGYKTAENIPMF